MPERPERTEENILKLASQVLESWDMESLLGYAEDRLQEGYRENEAMFNEDWEEMFGSEAQPSN